MNQGFLPNCRDAWQLPLVPAGREEDVPHPQMATVDVHKMQGTASCSQRGPRSNEVSDIFPHYSVRSLAHVNRIWQESLFSHWVAVSLAKGNQSWESMNVWVATKESNVSPLCSHWASKRWRWTLEARLSTNSYAWCNFCFFKYFIIFLHPLSKQLLRPQRMNLCSGKHPIFHWCNIICVASSCVCVFDHCLKIKKSKAVFPLAHVFLTALSGKKLPCASLCSVGRKFELDDDDSAKRWDLAGVYEICAVGE